MNASNTLEKEFLEVLEGHKGVIYKVANAYQSDPEERQDLIQEIILQLWRAFPKYDSTFALTTWIYRISLNVCLTLLKKKKNSPLHFASDQLPENLVEDSRAFADESLHQLYSAIKQLKEVDRAVILLYLEEKSYAEIADIIGTNPNNIGVRIN